MWRGLLLGMVITTVSFANALADEPEVSFEGKWKLESMRMAGQEFATLLGEVVLEIKGDRYTSTINGTQQDKGKIEIDTTVTPARIKVISDNETAPDLVGIGKIEEGKAIFALRPEGQGDRPNTFEPNDDDASLMNSRYSKAE